MNLHTSPHLAKYSGKIMASCYRTRVPFIHLIKKPKWLFCHYYILPNKCNNPMAFICYSYMLCRCLISLLIWLHASWNLHLPVCFCCILQEIMLKWSNSFEPLQRVNYDSFCLTWVTLLYCTWWSFSVFVFVSVTYLRKVGISSESLTSSGILKTGKYCQQELQPFKI